MTKLFARTLLLVGVVGALWAPTASADIRYWSGYMAQGSGAHTNSWSIRTYDAIYGNPYAGKVYYLEIYSTSGALVWDYVSAIPASIPYTGSAYVNAECYRTDGTGGLVFTNCWTN